MHSDWNLVFKKTLLSLDNWSSIQVNESEAPGTWNIGFDARAKRVFPKLDTLIRTARRTRVRADSDTFDVLVWETAKGTTRGWVCAAPSDPPAEIVHENVILLSRCFGGIIESWSGEHEFTWLAGNRFTLNPTRYFFADDDQDYLLEVCQDLAIDPASGPNLSDFIVVADRGTGEDVLCHRASGEILHFSQECRLGEGLMAYNDVVELFPVSYIEGAPDFATWVELVAELWLGIIDTDVEISDIHAGN